MLSTSLNQINPNECIGNSLSAINSNFSQLGTHVDSIEAALGNNVTKIIAGSNITISPSSGTGVVTISSTINSNSIILGGTNIGTTGAGVFKEKTGQNLAFKRIVGTGTNIVVTEDSNTIKIAALGINGTVGVTTQDIGPGVGITSPNVGSVLPFKTLVAGNGIAIGSGSSFLVLASTLTGINVGTGTGVFKELSGNKLAFKTITPGSSNVEIQENSKEISIRVNEVTTGEKIGSGASFYKEKNNNTLLFRTLVASTDNVSITEQSQQVLIGVNESTTAQNVGTGSSLFVGKTQNKMQFKTLKKGNNIQITDTGTELQIDAILTGPDAGGEINTATNLASGVGLFKTKNGVELQFKSLSAGPGIVIRGDTDTVIISAIPPKVGQGDVIGSYNVGEGNNSKGLYTGVKTEFGYLNFKSLSGGPNLTITSNSNNVNIQLSGVITAGQNDPLGTGVGELFKPSYTDNVLEARTLKGGTGITIATGTHDIIISSTLQASLDSLATSYKNKIINGNFDIWQWAKRSIINETTGTISTVIDTSITDSNNYKYANYLADRWPFVPGGPTISIPGQTPSPQSATFEKKIVNYRDINTIPSRPTAYGRLILGARATGSPATIRPTVLMHRIENAYALAGKKVTLSFYARSNNIGSNTIPLYLNQYYKGSVPQTWQPNYFKDNLITTFIVTPIWQRYTTTFTVPSMILGILQSIWGNVNDPDFNSNFQRATTDSFTQLLFELPGLEGRRFDITSVQLEEGTIATTFEPRPPAAELALCQRYYENGDSFTSQFAATGKVNRVEIPFKTTKRTTPLMRSDRTVLLKNTGLNSFSHVVDHTWATTITETHARTDFSGYENGIVSNPYIYNWAADAEFLVVN